MTYEDFIKKPEETFAEAEKVETGAPLENQSPATETETPELSIEEHLDIQKAVVEEMAAEKAEQEIKLDELANEKKKLEKELEAVRQENAKLRQQVEVTTSLQNEVLRLKTLTSEMNGELAKVGDLLARNSESPASNQVSVLDRNEEVEDRFEGETRDHILEVLKEARDAAEKDGRLRRAQLLEAVLAVNEPCGTLAKKRAELDKIFADNLNVINGLVINELDKLGIRYKDGENYLLAKEIARRSY